MSGHSKWSTIKRQKGLADAKRGAVFTKIGNQIAIAARQGTDPSMNSALAMVIEKAKQANMPTTNIERAIARVADKNSAVMLEETYEAYGPGGVGIIIEVATDNKNRTFPEVKSVLTKNGGRIADPGSVAFQFKRKGVIVTDSVDEDGLLEIIDAGAEDAVEEDGSVVIYTTDKELMNVRKKLIERGMAVKDAELQYVPVNVVEITDKEIAEKVMKLMDALDDLDDVTQVHTNAELK